MRAFALKVDVDTLRGTREGVPALTELFQRHKAQATFLFSLGPDHTGRAIKRIFRPGFFSKVKRTSVVSHYGVKTLMYGTLLPGPHIGRRAGAIMREVQKQNFEVGIHCYDHVTWQDYVQNRDLKWTMKQLDRASSAFKDVFGSEPTTHGAAGWQMNMHAFRWLERFKYASDTRGDTPFYPRIEGEVSKCLQLPTTLPTMDEVLGVDGVDETKIADYLLKLTAEEKEFGHVFTLHAELEGMKLLPALEQFLIGLKKQGYELVSMGDLHARVKAMKVPVCDLDYGTIEGRSGLLYRQGERVTNAVHI
jgi:undecaprenyl phosphate-alpha-L-ara4FN deformylase